MLDESFGLFWRGVSAISILAAIWICNTHKSFFVSPRIPLVWCSGCCYKFMRNTRQRHFCPLEQVKMPGGMLLFIQMQHGRPQNTQQRHFCPTRASQSVERYCLLHTDAAQNAAKHTTTTQQRRGFVAPNGVGSGLSLCRC